jgi:hypothetical protein
MEGNTLKTLDGTAEFEIAIQDEERFLIWLKCHFSRKWRFDSFYIQSYKNYVGHIF